VRLVLESLPAAAHSLRIDSEGGSGPWNCSVSFLSKKKKKKEKERIALLAFGLCD